MRNVEKSHWNQEVLSLKSVSLSFLGEVICELWKKNKYNTIRINRNQFENHFRTLRFHGVNPQFPTTEQPRQVPAAAMQASPDFKAGRRVSQWSHVPRGSVW